MLAVEKHKSTPLAPVGIGLTLFACELWALCLTGGSLNHKYPNSRDTSGVLTVFLVIYLAAKHSEYWKLAPGQDTQNPKNSPDPVKNLEAGS